MKVETQIKSRSLQGVSDLTLVAPIRVGLIPALDTRSYETRLRLLLRTLGALRISSREVEPVRLFSDAVERIRSIHSFRLAILEGEPRKLLLAVAFDSAWEPYMRRIWHDLGPLLDVIFCNCEGYRAARDHSFAEYAKWVRSAQVQTEFFYNASSLTVDDLQYLRKAEKLRRDQRPEAADAELPGLRIDEPAQLALQSIRALSGKDTTIDQAMRALSALYRLADMYPPDSADGGYLLRAAHALLRELEDREVAKAIQDSSAAKRFHAQLKWFYDVTPPALPERSIDEFDLSNVQGGIANPYQGITHACLLLVGLDGPAAAHALLRRLRLDVTAEGAQAPADGIFVNVGFTFEGLRVAGLSSPSLEEFPQEFREGMEARASLLGDSRYNHPRNWSLPERNWPEPDKAVPERVELSTVHLIVQLACARKPFDDDHEIAGNENHPLRKRAIELLGKLDGVQLLSVQAMWRDTDEATKLPRGHFGFVDGISQPALGTSVGRKRWRDQFEYGDLLLGYRNTLDDPPDSNDLRRNGTFLVIRKLREDVQALDAALERESTKTGLNAGEIKAKMMGRTLNGGALAVKDRPVTNDFDYSGDLSGALCPYQSHVRRANPRTEVGPDRPPVPRIVRRGMSYGPQVERNPEAERGLIFMAYNASIAEQFEVIQRWLSGGNSTDAYSALRDPFVGVPQDDDPQVFAFEHEGKVERVDLASARPFVKLEWGAYVFVPSIAAIGKLSEIAAEAAKTPATKDDSLAPRGAALIARLLAAEQKLGFEGAATQWKTMLEDISARTLGYSASIWAAIRELRNGVLRTPFGVLVCSKELVMEILRNDEGRYTATGYLQRMRRSSGEIYLGLDAGDEYDSQASKANEAILSVKLEDAFWPAFKHTQKVLSQFIAQAHEVDGNWEITVDVKEISDQVLAPLSVDWFGLPDGHYVAAGGWDWSWDPKKDPPRCPGHFLSPSRYLFQPDPGPEASRYGEEHGQALRIAVERFVATERKKPDRVRAAPLAKVLFEAIADDDLLAGTLIGVMMGFLPTVDGNLRSCLYEWINDRSLWDHQLAYLSDPTKDKCERAKKTLLDPLKRTMQLRPVPELLWRVALKKHSLHGVELMPGDKVVVSLVSATQQDLREGKVDVYPVFGGNRGADPRRPHACPGYEMAMGVLLGVIAALLEAATLRPTPAPLTLSLSGKKKGATTPAA